LNRKLKITWITDTNGYNLFRWNFLDNQDEMIRQGHVSQWLRINTPDLFERVKGSDIVIYYRCTTRHQEMIQRMQRQGIRVGYLTDDMLWIQNEVAYHPTESQAIVRYFDQVDFLLFHTEYLASKATGPAERLVKSTALPESFLGRFEVAKRNDGRFRVCLTKGHLTPGLVQFVREFLQHLDKTTNAHFIDLYYFSSHRIAFQTKNIQTHATPEVHGDLESFYAKVQTLAPDCVINPIPETEFMNSKGYIKFFETVMLQVPLVTTRTFQNMRSMGADESALFASTPDEMAERVAYLMQNPESAAQMPQKARERCLKDYTVPVVTQRFIADIKALLERPVREGRFAEKAQPDLMVIEPTPIAGVQLAANGAPPAETVLPKDWFSHCTQSLLYPITFGRFFEQRMPAGVTCRSIHVRGHNYRARVTQPIRCDIIRQGSILQTGFIQAKHAQDGVWWPVTFDDVVTLKEGDVVRFTNQDKRPVSFYYSDFGSRKEAAAMRFMA
jgi:hypothetical protein